MLVQQEAKIRCRDMRRRDRKKHHSRLTPTMPTEPNSDQFAHLTRVSETPLGS
jgi:hypothetical protein